MSKKDLSDDSQGAIKLSGEDSQAFVELLENPPAPNAALRRAFESHAELLGGDADREALKELEGKVLEGLKGEARLVTREELAAMREEVHRRAAEIRASRHKAAEIVRDVASASDMENQSEDEVMRFAQEEVAASRADRRTKKSQ